MSLIKNLSLRASALGRVSVMGRTAIVDMLIEQKQFYIQRQRNIFKIEPTPPFPEDPKRVLPIIMHPLIEVDRWPKAMLHTMYYEPINKERIDVHLVFGDEIVPYSKRIDEAYRKARLALFGRTDDIESISLILDEEENVKRVRMPVSGSLLNGYISTMHWFSTTSFFKKEGARPVILTKTYNHMMGFFPLIDPLISLTGGYVTMDPEIKKGIPTNL